MQIFGLKTCDTCRKAARALPGARLVDVRKDGLPEPVLNRALAAFPDRLINTRSTTWRGLDEAERAGDPKALMQAHPALMKRPLIDDGGTLHLGWDATVQSALLGSGGRRA